MDNSTFFALQQIVDGLHRSGAIGPRNVRAIVENLRGQQALLAGRMMSRSLLLSTPLPTPLSKIWTTRLRRKQSIKSLPASS